MGLATIRKIASQTPTSIEAETYAALKDLGILFEPQRRIGKFIVDAFIPDRNIVIECQGDYFHCNPRVYPDGPKYKSQRRGFERDIMKRSFFADEAYTFIELWELDIKQNGAKALIQAALNQ